MSASNFVASALSSVFRNGAWLPVLWAGSLLLGPPAAAQTSAVRLSPAVRASAEVIQPSVAEPQADDEGEDDSEPKESEAAEESAEPLPPTSRLPEPTPLPDEEVGAAWSAEQWLDHALERPDPWTVEPQLSRAWQLREGLLEPLILALEARRERLDVVLIAEGVDPAVFGDARQLGLQRLLSRVHWRSGRVRRAHTELEQIPEEDRVLEDHLDLAEWLDAQGLREEAEEAYDALLELHDLDSALRARLLLRRALVAKSPEKALDELSKDLEASEQDRNRAAMILALMGKPQEALERYVPVEEERWCFAEQIRRVEWALASEAWEAAMEHGRAAVEAAAVPRDRRYGLSLLAEAHRRAGDPEGLLEYFGALESPAQEVREMWIDVLRELGRSQDALELFRSGDRSGWSTSDRRELLEICRETGQDELLVNAYRQQISVEPQRLEWREGLARFFLEEGRLDEAEALYRPLLSELREPLTPLDAAESAKSVGLDEVSLELADQLLQDPLYGEAARLFRFRLAEDRGQIDLAARALAELDEVAEPDSSVRVEVAEGYERLERLDAAVQVLEGLREARGGNLGTDLEQRYALLLSKVDREEDALDVWRELWERLGSSPRRHYAEDRLMTVASRLGTLGEIAIELEDALAAGAATDAQVELLVQLYIKVGDPASANEIVREHLEGKGTDQLEVLDRRAKVYAACEDFYHYEKLLLELVELDEAGRLDRLRELVLSKLERGRRDEAIAMLPELRSASEDDAIADEFEAGILELAGLEREALISQLKGLARYPGRIDTHLIVGNMMLESGMENLAAGRAQFLVASAEPDDLFTVAIDCILNLRAQESGSDELVRWAQRKVLERLAADPQRFFLYRLLVDVSEEVGNRDMTLSALRASLPVAGERRTVLLRELMNRVLESLVGRRGFDDGSERSVWEGGADPTEFLMAGRRLLAQGELVPPAVYMNLADAFLAGRDVDNAMLTFGRASELLDPAEVYREAGAVLRKSRYYGPSREFYQRLLAASPGDVDLIRVLGELSESEGDDEAAQAYYQRGMERILSSKPRYSSVAGTGSSMPTYFWGGNVSSLDQARAPLLKGLVATLDSGAQAAATIRDQAGLLFEELERVPVDELRADLARDRENDGREFEPGQGLDSGLFRRLPRAQARVDLVRDLAAAFDRWELAEDLDRRLRERFPEDRLLVSDQINARLNRGYLPLAEALLADSKFAEDEALRDRVGLARDGGALLGGAEAGQRVLRQLTDASALRETLLRVDVRDATAQGMPVVASLVAAGFLVGDLETSEILLSDAIGRFLNQQSLTLAKRVDRDLAKRLSRSFLERTLDEDPSRVLRLVDELGPLFKELRGQISRSRLEDAITLAASESVQSWGTGWPGLLALAEPEEQAELARLGVANTGAVARRNVLMSILSGLEGEIDADFESWFDREFREALRQGDGNAYHYDLLQMQPREGFEALQLAAIDATLELADVDPDQELSFIGTQLVLLGRLGRFEALGELLETDGKRAIFERRIWFSSLDARSELQNPEFAEAVVPWLEGLLEGDPDDAELRRYRWDILERGEPRAYRDALVAALLEDVDDRDAMRRLENEVGERLGQSALLVALEEVLSKYPDERSLERKVEKLRTTLSDPYAVLAWREELDKQHRSLARDRKQRQREVDGWRRPYRYDPAEAEGDEAAEGDGASDESPENEAVDASEEAAPQLEGEIAASLDLSRLSLPTGRTIPVGTVVARGAAAGEGGDQEADGSESPPQPTDPGDLPAPPANASNLKRLLEGREVSRTDSGRSNVSYIVVNGQLQARSDSGDEEAEDDGRPYPERAAEARVLLRRLWRDFKVTDPRFGSWWDPSRFQWPADAVEAETVIQVMGAEVEAPEPERVARLRIDAPEPPSTLPAGYLSGDLSGGSGSTANDFPMVFFGGAETVEGPTVFSVLAERTPEGLDEARRALRTMSLDADRDPWRQDQQDAIRSMLQPVVIEGELRERGLDAFVNDLDRRWREGRFGNSDLEAVIWLLERELAQFERADPEEAAEDAADVADEEAVEEATDAADESTASEDAEQGEAEAGGDAADASGSEAGDDEAVEEPVVLDAHGRTPEQVALMGELTPIEDLRSEQVEQLLDLLVAELRPGNFKRLKRSARLLGLGGRQAEAAALYRFLGLCEGMLDQGNVFYYGYNQSEDLLDEASKVLDEERLAETAVALADAKAAELYPYDPSRWNRCLDVWEEYLGREAAAERVRAFWIEAPLDLNVVARLVRLIADVEGAEAGADLLAECLQPQHDDGTRRMGGMVIYVSSSGSQRRGRPLTNLALNRLFPSDSGLREAAESDADFAERLEREARWRRVAAERLLDLREGGDLGLLNVHNFYLWLALRLEESGDNALAARFAPWIEADLPEDQRAVASLWPADLLFELGLDERAFECERELLAAGALPMQRVPRLLDHVRATRGPAAALELGSPVAEVAAWPAVALRLMECAEQLGEAEAAERWRMVVPPLERMDLLEIPEAAPSPAGVVPVAAEEYFAP
jgi:uncharacterized protein YheU (UPF0270 family)